MTSPSSPRVDDILAGTLLWIERPLANLAIRLEDGRIEMLSDFGYAEFRQRLGR